MHYNAIFICLFHFNYANFYNRAEYGTISILVIERYHNVGSILVNAYNICCCPNRLAWIEDRYAVYDGNILIKSIETLKEV